MVLIYVPDQLLVETRLSVMIAFIGLISAECKTYQGVQKPWLRNRVRQYS